jgi:hypothetical protein
MDLSYGPFPELRSTWRGYVYAAENNPYWLYSAEPRPEFDPPGIVAVTDVPLDDGGALCLEWELSDDDASLDYYNVYRKVIMGARETAFLYLASVPTGTTTYIDRSIDVGASASYMISAAHHGGPGIPVANGDLGIWNEFSDASTFTGPVDNLRDNAIILTCENTLIVCPQGDHDSLTVFLAVHGSDGSPTGGIPAEEILFLVSKTGAGICGGDTMSVKLCDGDSLWAAHDTDAGGKTMLAYSAIGGCGTLEVTAEVMGKPVFDTLAVAIRSPDSNGDGAVGISDLAQFGSAYPSHCGEADYCTCADYNLDCSVGISDLGILAFHYCPNNCPTHECGMGWESLVVEGSPSPSSEERNPSDDSPARTPVFEVEGVEGKLQEEGRLSVPLGIRGVSSLLACHVVVRYEGTVKSAEFAATDYLHDPVVIPVRVDDGKKTVMVALAASAGVVTREAEGSLGSLVLEGAVVPHSLEIVEATILDGDWREVPVVTGGVKDGAASGPVAGEAAAGEGFETALYQSYPNPANPAATISFSLKERSHVTLRIFTVNGELVRTVVDETLDAKLHRVFWDGKDEWGAKVSSGVYFYRLEAGLFADQKKLVVLK